MEQKNEGSKPWPAKGELVNFHEITDPIYEALLIAIEMGDDVYNKGIEWSGLDVGDRMKLDVFPPHEALQAYNLAYSNNDQGINVIQVLLGIAVQLGMEQGRRQKMSEIRNALSVINTGFDVIGRLKEILTNIMKVEDKDIVEDIKDA